MQFSVCARFGRGAVSGVAALDGTAVQDVLGPPILVDDRNAGATSAFEGTRDAVGLIA